ncbi:MAG TPA: hypothetical protein VMU39_29535, partial [Solirubrobacteraceae bacterium]|nr:hypothetical protein [Solirubrobacteraceae bacterium]
VEAAKAAPEAAVATARARARSWNQIGLSLGVSRQAARQRFGDSIRVEALAHAEKVRRARMAGARSAKTQAATARRYRKVGDVREDRPPILTIAWPCRQPRQRELSAVSHHGWVKYIVEFEAPNGEMTKLEVDQHIETMDVRAVPSHGDRGVCASDPFPSRSGPYRRRTADLRLRTGGRFRRPRSRANQ